MQDSTSSSADSLQKIPVVRHVQAYISLLCIRVGAQLCQFCSKAIRDEWPFYLDITLPFRLDRTRAVFDGIRLLHTLYGPFQSIQQNILYVLDASIPTNAITQSPTFNLASGGQFLIKQPLENSPVVAYDAVNVVLSPQTINYGYEPLDAKKLYRSNYELKSSFVIAFGTGCSNTQVWSPIGTGCGNSPIVLAKVATGIDAASLPVPLVIYIYAYNVTNGPT
ncbi:MAG: hypothetical protein EZS28_007945 [Streblomastix strix]|uniref:Uncharacterized protein n=1 Tax=Streblomastix strix TaxID=222440 RepID=A0A5J4WNN1_9EUKA|nr:MAG: hypothetical protein EZS28_007945 [Streblomastix strix]